MLTTLLSPPTASAQSLETFLSAAQEHAIDPDEAAALTARASAVRDEARARLLPSFSAVGAYQRNEVEVRVSLPAEGGEARQAVITPHDQLSATLTLDVPLLDLSAWESLFAAEASLEAATAREEGTRIDVQIATATAYCERVAAIAVLGSSARSLETARENLAFVRTRLASGLSSDLDETRARADVARAEETLAAAELEVALSERTLVVLTGITPDIEGFELVRGAPLTDEGEIESWLVRLDDAPAVRAARHDRESAERAHDGAWMAFLPTLSASAAERLTNAPGFGPETYWTLGATLSFRLDFARPAALDRTAADLSASLAREERARADQETRIREAFLRVRAFSAQVSAARAVTESTAASVAVARQRWEAGLGTALEVSQAARDHFAAEVSEIQAESNLALQRVVLRLRSDIDRGGLE